MQSNQVKIKNLLLVIGLSSLLLQLTSCGTTHEITSATINQTSDGPVLACNRYDADSKTKYGIAQLDDQVLVRIEILEKANQMMYLNGGTKVYLDPRGKKKRGMYIGLPEGREKRDRGNERQYADHSSQARFGKQGEIEFRLKKVLSETNNNTVFHINEQNYLLHSGDDTLGIRSNLFVEGEKLVHAISISKKYINTDVLSVGIVGQKVSRPEGGERPEMGGHSGGMERPGGAGGMGGPSGMGGGHGGSGGGAAGMGGRPNGTSMEQMQAANFWFTYVLTHN